jgi:hypothetical protein
VLPGDAGVQDEQDSLQRLPIRQTLAARVAKAPLLLRQQRFDQLSHSSSETIPGATATGTPPSLTTDADGLRRHQAGPCRVEATGSAAVRRRPVPVSATRRPRKQPGRGGNGRAA